MQTVEAAVWAGAVAEPDLGTGFHALESPDLHNGPTDAAVVHGRGPSPDLSSDFLFGPQPTMVFGASLLPVQAALHGLGVALTDLSLIRDHLDGKKLVVLPGMPPLVRGTGYYLAYSSARRASPAMLAFRDWLLPKQQTSPWRLMFRQTRSRHLAIILKETDQISSGRGKVKANLLDRLANPKLISAFAFTADRRQPPLKAMP